MLFAGEFCEKKIVFCMDYNPCVDAAKCNALDTDYG